MKKSSAVKLLSLVMTLIMIISFSTFEVSATAGVTYSMGGAFHNGDDIRSAANYFALCGYKSYWNDEVDMAYLNSSTRLNSDIVYFSAHGAQDLIELPDVYLADQYIQRDSITAIINDFAPLSNAKLYIYDACLTASNGDGSNINLCSETLASGVDTVIGWTVSIDSEDAYNWQKRFQNRLALGHSVSTSANYANGFNDYNDNRIKSWRIYGNGSLIVKKSSKNNINLPVEERDYTELKYKNISVEIEHKEPAIQAIKEINPTFSSKNYKIIKTKTSENDENYTIDYLMMNNGYVTSSGYSVIVEDSIVVGVQDNTVVINENKNSSSYVPVITQDDIDDANEAAREKVMEINENYTVEELSGEAYYDVDTNKYYYKVFTVYKTPGGAFGAFSHFEPI